MESTHAHPARSPGAGQRLSAGRIAVQATVKIRAGHEVDDAGGEMAFHALSETVVAKGYKLLQQRDVLEKILESNSLNFATAKALWPGWMQETGRWLFAVYVRNWSFGSTPHKALFDDWKRNPFKPG